MIMFTACSLRSAVIDPARPANSSGPNDRSVSHGVPAGLAGYGTTWDRSPGELAVLTLLLIDVAVFVVLIMVAALVVTRRRRRSNGRPPAPAGAPAAGRAGRAMAPREIA